jgi:lambda repressor-like predicted transcriptional regulator
VSIIQLTKITLVSSSKSPYIIDMAPISVSDQIYLAIAYKGTNLSAVAREMGMTRQNLHQRIERNSLKQEELRKIGKILGGEYVSYFAFPGDVIIGRKAEGKSRQKEI